MSLSTTNADWLTCEPFTLTLSAGFFGFFAHTGFISALEQKGIFPNRVVGVSAGALAGGLWASGINSAKIKDTLLTLKREEFWDPCVPIGGILKGKKFAHKLNVILAEEGVSRFEHCPIEFTAVVFDLLTRQTARLSNGKLEPAIRASCALPFLFRPVRVGFRFYLDGGVQDRPGFSALDVDERTLFHHLPHSSIWSGIHGDEAEVLRSSSSRNVFQINDLPKVNPFQLERGHQAMELAEKSTLIWLEQPYLRDGLPAHQRPN